MARAGTSQKLLVFRARVILESATGADNVEVAQRLGTTEQTVTLWRGRFLQEGMGGLADLARSGRPERIRPGLKGRILSEVVRCGDRSEIGLILPAPSDTGTVEHPFDGPASGIIKGDGAASLVDQRH
jgi:hypothetical protein